MDNVLDLNESIISQKKDIVVVCERLAYKDGAYRDTKKLLQYRGLLKRCTRSEFELNNGCRITFVPDREDQIRGRRNCNIMRLAEYEDLLKSEFDRACWHQRGSSDLIIHE